MSMFMCPGLKKQYTLHFGIQPTSKAKSARKSPKKKKKNEKGAFLPPPSFLLRMQQSAVQRGGGGHGFNQRGAMVPKKCDKIYISKSSTYYSVSDFGQDRLVSSLTLCNNFFDPSYLIY